MGERLRSSNEQRVEQQGKFSLEKATSRLLAELMGGAAELSERRFASQEEARRVSDEFAEKINLASMEVGDISQVKIRATGSNLRASNVEFISDETGVSVEIDTDEPFITLPPFSEKEGYYFGAPMRPGQDAAGHFITPHLILQEMRMVPVSAENGLPVAAVCVQDYTHVPLTGDTLLEIPALEAHKAQKRAMAQVALKNTEKGTDILTSLRGLKKAFKFTDKHTFTQLENVELLHRLGTVSEEEVDVETVVAAVRELFGRDRQVLVKAMAHKGVEEGALQRLDTPGKVVDVLGCHEKLQLRGPTLVVECMEPTEDDDEGTSLYYVPLGYIESFEF